MQRLIGWICDRYAIAGGESDWKAVEEKLPIGGPQETNELGKSKTVSVKNPNSTKLKKRKGEDEPPAKSGKASKIKKYKK